MNFLPPRTPPVSTNTKLPTLRAAAQVLAPTCRSGPAATMSTIGAADPSTASARARPVYTHGQRTTNLANTTLYCDQLERGVRAPASSEELPPLARAGEIAAFGLRMNAGWPLVQFQQRTGFNLTQEWAPEIQRMIQMGYGKLDGQRFQLTSQGLRFASWVGSEFLRS